MTAGTIGAVACVILPHATALVGGRAAVMVVTNGLAGRGPTTCPWPRHPARWPKRPPWPGCGPVPARRRGSASSSCRCTAAGWPCATAPTPRCSVPTSSGCWAPSGTWPELALERVRLTGVERESRQALLERQHELAQAQQLAHIGSWQWRLGEDAITWSDELYRIFGLEPGERPVNFEWFMARIHADDRDAVRQEVDRALADRGNYMAEYRIVLRSGRVCWLHSRGQVMLDAAGDAAGFRGVCQEVTEQRQARDELLSRARQQAAVARLGQRALIEVDVAALMQEACALVADVLGIHHAKVFELVEGGQQLLLRAGVGWRPGLVGHFRLDLEQSSHATFTLASAEPVVVEDLRQAETRFAISPLLLEHEVKSGMSVVIPGQSDRSAFWAPTLDPAAFVLGGEVDFLQAVANVLGTVIERRRSDDQLAHQALHDPLTGLPNRSLLIDRLAQALARSDAQWQSTVAVLFLDVDRFKLINDGMDHSAGDAVLIETATRLSGAMRPGDTVARFGGDEFVVVTEEATDEALGRGDRPATPCQRHGGGRRATQPMQVTVSIGVVVADAAAPTRLRCFVTPTPPCTRPRSAGAPGSSCSTRACDGAGDRTAGDSKRALRQAIDADELRVVYQPDRRLTTGPWSAWRP